MKRSIWTLVLVAMLVVACGPAGLSTPTPDEAPAAAVSSATDDEELVILRFAVSQWEQNRYENLIEAFESENPDVHIMLVPIEQTLGMDRPGAEWSDDAYLLLAAAADVIAAPATREAVQQGALLDLSHLMAADSSLADAAFYPGVLESMQWGGGTWSLPTEASYALIYYDASLFDAAGVPHPEPGWTWDDMLSAARALTIRDGDVVSQWGLMLSGADAATLVQARADCLLFDAEASPTIAKVNTSAVVEAVRWYTDLFLSEGVSPYYGSSQGGMGPADLSGGRPSQQRGRVGAAMSLGRNMMAFSMRGRDQGQTTIGYAPFPVDEPDDHSTPLGVNGLSISAGTHKADLAWQWVSYLVQQSGRTGRFGAMMNGTIPALPSVAAAAGLYDEMDEGLKAALDFAIDHALVDNYGGTGYDTFESAVAEIMENDVAVEKAMADCQDALDDELAQAAEAAPTPVSDLSVTDQVDKALSAGGVIIQYGVGSGGRFAQESLAALAEAFQEANPDVVVELKTPQGFRGGMDLVEMAAEYDCFQATPTFSEEALAAIVSMEPFLASDPDVSKDDFYPSVTDQFMYQGQLWGIPGSATVNVMSYNKALFDAAGVDYPEPDWTTEDFLEAAVALTLSEGENQQYGYAPGIASFYDLISFMDRLGADMLDDSVDPPRLNVNSSQVIKAMRWYTSLTTQYGVTPEIEQTDEPGPMGGARERQSLINQGRVAMWLEAGGGMGGRGGFAARGPDAVELDIGVAPLPLGANSEEGSGFQSVSGYFISADSEARQASWKWIAFLTESATVSSGVPGRISTAESDAYRQQAGEERAVASLASISVGTKASFFQRLSEEGSWLWPATNWLTEAHDRIIEGEMTVEESLNHAQELIDAYRDCMIASDAFGDREAQSACVSQAESTVMGQ